VRGAHDETRLGLLPLRRRRSTAWGVQPAIPVPHTFTNVCRDGAVEPTPGESFVLALPYRNGQTCQVWVAAFTGAWPDSFSLVVREPGALPTAPAVP
jgi:hypothetical protein